MSQLQILDFFYLTSDSCSFLRSHGVPNILRSHTSIRFQSLTNESQHRHHRKAIISCLRDGYTKYFDFAVIGSGVAGLWYAIEVAKQGTVAVITKAEPQESNTNYAQGGVSAVLCPSDSVESHVLDTIVAGAYLCDEETVRVSCQIKSFSFFFSLKFVLEHTMTFFMSMPFTWIAYAPTQTQTFKLCETWLLNCDGLSPTPNYESRNTQRKTRNM